MFQVIDILLGGTENAVMEKYVASFKAVLVPYCRSQHIQHCPLEFPMDPTTNTRPKAVRYQKYADQCFKLFVELFGDMGMTNYWHCYGSGHFYELMHYWGNLQRFRNEGAEALNIDLKMRFLKHTQRGGSKGRGVSRQQASRSEGLGKWLQRRYMWLTGLAWTLLGEQHMPQRMQDDRRAAAIAEREALLELDVDPGDTESDEEGEDEGGDGPLPGQEGAGENPAEYEF